jgi:hypothetical protein
MTSKVETFRMAKRVMRAHPDWTDGQVAEDIGVHRFDIAVVAEARKDLRATEECERTDFSPANPSLAAMRDAAGGRA